MGSSYVLATDPRGYPVDFSDTRWAYIVSKHEDLLTFGITEEDLKKAIEHPLDNCIYQNNNKYPGCCLYYHPVRGDLFIRVVVKYQNNIGEIPTAHLYGRSKVRGKILWRK